MQQSLDGWSGDDTGTSRSGDETDTDGTTFARDLDGDSVGLSKVGSPVSSTDWHDGEFGEDDGATDGGSDFLGALDPETDVAVAVTNDDKGLESGTLTGTGLLLDGLDLLRLSVLSIL